MELFAFGDIPHRVTLRTACEHQQTVGPLHPFPCGLSAQGGVRVVAGAGGKDLTLEVMVHLPSPQLSQEGREEGQLCLDISGAPAKELEEERMRSCQSRWEVVEARVRYARSRGEFPRAARAKGEVLQTPNQVRLLPQLQ